MAAASFIAAFRPPAATAAGKPAIKSAVAAVPIPPPSRFTRRRNYLRRKLLRTLTKPSPETLTPPQSPAEIPEIGAQNFELDPLPDIPAAAEPDFVSVEESDASNLVEFMAKEDSGVTSGRVSARTVVRYGLYIVGLLLVQTVVCVFIMGSDDDDERKNRRRRKGESGANGNWSLSANVGSFRGKLEMKSGSLLYVDEAEMEAKIAEIRMMAREAKEREKSNLGAGGSGSNDLEDVSDDEEDEVEGEDEDSRVRSGIEREINGRLTKVSRSLDTARENYPVMDVKFLNKPGQGAVEKGEKNAIGENEEDKMLMFEKKYKFKSSSSSKPIDKPKGFQGSGRKEKNRDVSGNDADLLNQTTRADTQNAEVSGRFQGDIQDSNVERTMEKRVVPPSNGRSSGKSAGSTRSAIRRDAKEADDEPDLWWLNLPCLFAVVMQHGSNDEGERGFYALTTTRDDPSQDATSYTVLFENHVDAQNFSHLLEAFFDELEGITTSVVPLPIKELNNAVKSQAKRVIVVRKGQLRLYAGQPLDEVETVLRTLVI